MKIGDYVAKITNEWQLHNKWMEFPDDPPVPIGIIVDVVSWWPYPTWSVLTSDGSIINYNQKQLQTICKKGKN